MTTDLLAFSDDSPVDSVPAGEVLATTSAEVAASTSQSKCCKR